MAYDRYIIAKTGSMVKDIIVFTEFKENWQYFFTQPTMTPDSPGDVDKILDVKEQRVRRGPGDPSPYIRKAHTRLFARTAKHKGSARPGNPYVVAEKAAAGLGWRERRQFAILGNDMDVIAYARAKAKMEVYLWSPNGNYTIIPGVAPGAQAVKTANP